jgi:hypothetical protein
MNDLTMTGWSEWHCPIWNFRPVPPRNDKCLRLVLQIDTFLNVERFKHDIQDGFDFKEANYPYAFGIVEKSGVSYYRVDSVDACSKPIYQAEYKELMK